jgi:hypothetical protein
MVRYTSDFGGFPAAFQFNEKIASTPEGSFSTESAKSGHSVSKSGSPKADIPASAIQ